MMMLDNSAAKASVNVVMARVLPQRVVPTASIWRSATESLQIHQEYIPKEVIWTYDMSKSDPPDANVQIFSISSRALLRQVVSADAKVKIIHLG